MKRTNACLVVAIFILALCLVAESTFNPDDVPRGDRKTWCQNQVASCPLICADQGGKNAANTAEKNVCYVKTLQYECVCNNGFSPDASKYTQTIPYFICTQEVVNCKNACNDDATCIDGCNKECGVKNPPKRKNKDQEDTAGTDDQTGDIVDDASSSESSSDGGEDSGNVYGSAALTSVDGRFIIFLLVALAFSASI